MKQLVKTDFENPDEYFLNEDALKYYVRIGVGRVNVNNYYYYYYYY